MLKFTHVLELKSGTFQEVFDRTGTREWVRWRAFYKKRHELQEAETKKAKVASRARRR